MSLTVAPIPWWVELRWPCARGFTWEPKFPVDDVLVVPVAPGVVAPVVDPVVEPVVVVVVTDVDVADVGVLPDVVCANAAALTLAKRVATDANAINFISEAPG